MEPMEPNPSPSFSSNVGPNFGDSQRSGLGLDVGTQRVGVAVANIGVRFARPLTTLQHPEHFIGDIIDLCKTEDAAWVVIGLPRGMSGQETAQTAHTRDFGATLVSGLATAGLQIPVYWIDEALTSAKAEAELQGRGKGGKRGKPYAKADVDALAATYILEDYLKESHMKSASESTRGSVEGSIEEQHG